MASARIAPGNLSHVQIVLSEIINVACVSSGDPPRGVLDGIGRPRPCDSIEGHDISPIPYCNPLTRSVYQLDPEIELRNSKDMCYRRFHVALC